MKRFLSVILAFIMLLSFPVASVDAATTVTAVISTVPSKVPSVKVGTYKIKAKKLGTTRALTTQRNVKFKATTAGTYRFLLSNVKCSSLIYPIATFQLKYVKKSSGNVYKSSPLEIETGSGKFTKIKLYNETYQDAYYNYLIGRKEDAGQEVDETECWETMITDMEDRLKDGVSTDFFVDLELKKGDIIFISAGNCGEYSYRGNTDMVRSAFTYNLTIKKV